MTQYNWLFDRQIKEALGADDPDYPEENAKIALINRAVTNTLEKLLGRCLSKNQYTEHFTTKSNGKAFYDIYGNSDSGVGHAFKQVTYKLKHFPVDLSQSFTVELITNAQVDGITTLTSDDYVVDTEKGELVILKAVNGQYYRGLKVTYTAGYDAEVDIENDSELALANTIPSDLVQAALYQAMHVYDKQKFSNVNVRESRSQGSTNSSRFVNIHAIAPEAMAIIVQHRRMKIRLV